jgi:nitrogenase molybdenum-iron protein alpha chain
LKRIKSSKEYSGPYHGYDGFAIFARDMDLALNSPTWGLIGAPWNKKAQAKATAKAKA